MTELGKAAKRMGHEHPRVLRNTDPMPERATPAAKPHRKAALPFGFSYEEYWWWGKLVGRDARWETHHKWFKTAASRDQAMKHFQRTMNAKYFRNVQPAVRRDTRT